MDGIAVDCVIDESILHWFMHQEFKYGLTHIHWAPKYVSLQQFQGKELY